MWSETQAGLSRRTFLRTCAVVGMTGCAGLGANIELARIAIERPPPSVWRPVLANVITATLAFDHPAFPEIAPKALEDRMVALFELEDPSEFGVLHRALLAFDNTRLFGQALAPLVDTERNTYGKSSVEVADAEAHDAGLLAATRIAGRFVDGSLEKRRAYLGLWARSAFTDRRRFLRGVKSLCMVSAYSMPDLWRVIGYDGPLLT